LKAHGIRGGVLVVDDSDKKRSKTTKKTAKAHKIKYKTTGDYINGQSIVFLLLVTDIITIPVGFALYEPDPEKTAWVKKIKAFKKLGCPKDKRPPESSKKPNYPTKSELALQLLRAFQQFHPIISIQCVLADALYGNAQFVNIASKIFNGVQVISQIRNNQNVRIQGRTLSVKEYFARYSAVPKQLAVRGSKEVAIIVNSARLVVCAHGVKCFVFALKYKGESEYRYLIESDLTWRTEDIELKMSEKHMVVRDLGRLEPSPSLKYRAINAET